MNKIIIYKSKTGFTETYAKWLAEAMNCECVPFEERNKVALRTYDVILYGAGVYMGGLNGLKWFKESVLKLGKEIVVFAVGATPAIPAETERLFAQNFSEEEQKKVKFFYVQGGLKYETMGAVDKFLMSIFRKMVKKQGASEGERGMAESIQKSFDATDKEKIASLLNYVQGL